MKGILIVDHGSVRDEANDMMRCMANLLQVMTGPEVVVSFAHMDLAEPGIAAPDGCDAEAGGPSWPCDMRTHPRKEQQ